MPDEATLEMAGVRWRLRAGSDPAALAPLLARVLPGIEAAADLRSGRRKRVYRLALGAGPAPDHLLKRSAYPYTRGWLRRASGSKARRELAIAEALAASGVPVAVPLAAGERRRWGRVVECFLLTPLIAQARDLRQWWEDPAPAPAARRRVLVSLGRLVRRAHDAGLRQDDLAANNVLVCDAETGDLRLVDFERARLRRAVPARARLRMLAKLARSASVSAAQRLRFLRAYAGDRDGARAAWQQLPRAAAWLARRDERRWRRSATRDGRRFARIHDGEWLGYARRGVDPHVWRQARPAQAAQALGSVRVEPASDGWRIVYPRVPIRRARRLWARANTLSARGLGPVPLACVWDRERTLLIVAAAPGMRGLDPHARDAAQRRAVAHLLAELGALGALRAPLDAGMFALLPGSGRALRAQLVAPHAIRFTGLPGGARSRAAARAWLARRGAPGEAGV